MSEFLISSSTTDRGFSPATHISMGLILYVWGFFSSLRFSSLFSTLSKEVVTFSSPVF